LGAERNEMQTRLKFGKGMIEVAGGDQNGVPVLILAPHDEPHEVGQKAGEAGDQIPDAELTRRKAVVVEFPDFAGLDVLLYEVMGLWQRSHESKWDAPNGEVSG